MRKDFKNNKFLILSIVLLFIILMICTIFYLEKRDKSIDIDPNISVYDLSQVAIDRHVPKRAEWFEFENIQLMYNGYESINNNSPMLIWFKLFYDANNDVYMYSQTVSCDMEDLKMGVINKPGKIGTSYKTNSNIEITKLLTATEVVALIDAHYDIEIVNYFKENYTDMFCLCIQNYETCHVRLGVRNADDARYIEFEINLEDNNVTFVENCGLDNPPIN